MSGSLGDLITRFSSTGFPKVSQEIDQLTQKGKKAESATGSLAKSLTTMVGGYLSLTALMSGTRALVETNRDFEKLRAGLVTATGSTENMEVAWASLMKYAKDTPYGIQQVTESFTKLVNYGLTPSMEALTSYGDTASAMSKSLDQMIEAVADAATGEFERLKEFGIRAKNNGDTITFMFRGVATTVKNSSSEIEQYLINLGKTNFGGGMARQMATLDGAIANMSDTWDQFKYNLSDGTFAETASGSINFVTDALTELNLQMESGAMESNLDAWAVAWGGWKDTISTTTDDVVGLWNDMFGDMDSTNQSGIDAMSSYISHFPSELLKYLKIATGYVNGFAMDMKAYGSAVADYLNPLNWDTDSVTKNLQNQLAANKKYIDDTTADAEQQATYTQTMQDIFGEAALRKANERRKQDENNEKQHQDKLAQFRQNGGDVSNGKTKKAKKAGKTDEERLGEKNQAQFDQLVEDLLTEEEAINDSYRRRVEIIRKNTEEGSSLQKELIDRAADQRAKDLEDRRKQSLAQVEQIRMDLLSEEDALTESYNRRRDIIMENEKITGEQRVTLMTALEERYAEQQQALMLNQVAMMSGYLQSSLSTMTGALADAGAESNTIYKALFAAQKAMAIPSMIVSTEEGATKALALGPVAGPIAAGAIRALGYASMATVAGQAIAGLFDQGGLIPAGKSGIVGEFGPELVDGPAIVTSRKATMDKINNAAGGGVAGESVRPILNQNFYLNGTGVGDAQLKSMMTEAARNGAQMGYDQVLSDVSARGNISRKLGR